MSTNTPRVGFYMPADDGSEPINVATDLNDNLEKLDAVIGFVPSTSIAEPTAMYDGMASYETDTGRAKFRKGGVWNYLLTAGASFLSNILMGLGTRIGIGTNTPSVALDIYSSDTTTEPSILRYRAVGDSFPRMQVDRDGIRMGSGTSTADVEFYRPTSNQLAITGSLSVGSGLSVTGDSSLSNVTITGSLDIDGPIVGDMLVSGMLSGTGINVPNIIRKGVVTTRTSTVTPTADPDIQFPAEANSSYFVELFLSYAATTAVDFKFNWTVPVGTSGLSWVLGEAPGQTDRENTLMRTGIHQPTSDIVLGGHTTGLYVGALITLSIAVGATPGQVQFKWSQNVSNATDGASVRDTTVLRWQKVA